MLASCHRRDTVAWVLRDMLALDSVNAGVGDMVLVVQEGQGAAQILKSKKVPVHSVIVAVVDGFDVVE